MNIDRVQGLIDLYHKAGKSRAAVRTMADYLMRQGLLSQADVDAVEAALEEQDGMEERIDIRALITERDALAEENAQLKAERDGGEKSKEEEAPGQGKGG